MMSGPMYIPGADAAVNDDLMHDWLVAIAKQTTVTGLTRQELRATVAKLVSHLSAGNEYVARHIATDPSGPVALNDVQLVRE